MLPWVAVIVPVSCSTDCVFASARPWIDASFAAAVACVELMASVTVKHMMIYERLRAVLYL